MGATEIAIIVGVLLIFLVGWWFSEDQRNRRALRKAPQVTIAAFPAGGYHKVVGRLELHEQSLRSPMSERTCALYEVLVEQKVDTGRNSHSWRTVIHEVRQVPFIIDDGTGRVLVEAEQANLVIDRDQHSRSGTFDDPTPTEQAFLDAHGKSGTGWIFNKTLRYREGVLEPGEEVAVLGSGLPEGGGLKLCRVGKRPLYISDDPSMLG